MATGGAKGPIYLIYLKDDKIEVLFTEYHQDVYDLKFPPENNNYKIENLLLAGYKDSSVVMIF